MQILASGNAALLVSVLLTGGCGSDAPSGPCFFAAAGAGGVRSQTGGAAVTAGRGSVAGTSSSQSLQIEFEPSGSEVEAAAVGVNYRFVMAHYSAELVLLAEGGGPPVLVSGDGCSAPPSYDTVPLPDAGWAVQLIGFSHGPAALVCNLGSCMLCGVSESGASGELRLIPASTTTKGEWTHMDTFWRDGDEGICLVGPKMRRCFGKNGWLPDESLPYDTPSNTQFPLCPNVTLVDYAEGWGVTSDGRLIALDNSASAEQRCRVASEPLGSPLALIGSSCGINVRLWLVTERGLYREVKSNGCGCTVD